ncbi:MAG TPA: TIR domain-containing protein [Fimbriimonadaceae bacterium]|nr:TIR domain-containing protein [Fimbriimonadaceae bacterium]
MTPAKFRYDVFLSHNSADKSQVRRLAERLKQAGLRVWLDDWIVKPGDIVSLKVDEGLEQSRVLLLCVSPNALASGWVALERSTAIHRDPDNADRRFIPLLLADCDLPDTLRRYRYVDYREEADAAFAEVLEACQPGSEETMSVPKSAPRKRKVRKPEPLAEQPKPDEALAILEREVAGHKNWIPSLAVSPDSKWCASASWDKTIKIWDLGTGECRLTLKGHTDDVNSVAITADGSQILSGSDDRSARIWDSTSGRQTKRLPDHPFSVDAVLPMPQGRILTGTTGDDRALRIWDIAAGKLISEFKVDQTVMCAASNSDGSRVVIGGHRGRVACWNVAKGTRIFDLEGHREGDLVWCVAITRDGRFAASGSEDKTIKVWDLEQGACIGTLEGHKGAVLGVSFSPDETLIASTGFMDGTIRLWDWRSGTCLQIIDTGLMRFPISVAFTPDGSRLVVGTAEGSILVYRLTGARPAPSAEATRSYVNAKVVLLGEGTVGKTSLAHRLIDDQYVVSDRTHGMNVWQLGLPLPPDATREREALLWDLAGQEDYRLIHSLFLQETALALLLINPQNANPFRETGDWLKMLKCATHEQDHRREANRLLILSQVDVGGPKVSDAKLSQFCRENSFASWLPTSAKTGENCSDEKNGGEPSKLKQLIADSIPWDKLPWTSTPRLLAELKSAVVAMRDERDIRLLRFAELAQRLEQALPGEKFGEPDVRTAVTLLANQGLARPLKFGDLVLLQPELLNGYASAIVRAARAHIDEIGCVLESDIYGPTFDFTGVDRLKHRPDEELLLRALVQTFLDHSLCIAEPTPHGQQLVFPSQYRREKEIPRDPDIFVSYTFSGEWQSVWTTLVVRLWYSQEFEHKELWRNAAEFASPKGFTLGLKIDNQQGEGTAKISFYFDKDVQDELKALFIEYGHRHLARYAAEVTRDRRYVCPGCGKPVKDLDAVRKRLDAKKEFITCQECDEHVPLIDFIEQRLKSDPVARKILAMDETTTRGLDTQALEQILIGHMMAISGEANQIFRPVTLSNYGIDGEVEFKDDDGNASGKRIYVQLKSGDSYLRTRKSDGVEVFDVKNDRHLDYWISQPVDVYLVVRQTDEISGAPTIRWMNVTRYLNARKDKKSRQIVFAGEKLDMEAMYRVRDVFFPPR